MDHLGTSKLLAPLFLYQTYKLCCQHRTDNNINPAVPWEGCRPPAVMFYQVTYWYIVVVYDIRSICNNSSKKGHKVFKCEFYGKLSSALDHLGSRDFLLLLFRKLLPVYPSGLDPRDALTHWPLTPTMWVVSGLNPHAVVMTGITGKMPQYSVMTICILSLSGLIVALPHTDHILASYLSCKCHFTCMDNESQMVICSPPSVWLPNDILSY